jgi:hypothetical protein
VSTPSKVVVTRTFTYDVPSILQEWRDVGDHVPTWEEIFEVIHEWAHEDMQRPAEILDFRVLDESDNEIQK